MTESGELLEIWSKRMRRGPMDSLQEAHLEPGGLRGDASFGRKYRQVTLLQEELWRVATAELGTSLAPSLRRANLLLRGIDLVDSRGKVLQIGSCRLRIQGETRPCNLMDEQHPGLQEALKPPWRGGAFAEVLDEGEIHPGDRVTWQDEDAAEA